MLKLSFNFMSQTNSLTPYMGVCGFFVQVKVATSLLASLDGDNKLF